MNIQSKILDAIQERIERAELEYVKNEMYANTGIVYAQQKFTTLFAMYYNFQSGYASLTFAGDAVTKLAEGYDLAAFGLREGGGHIQLPAGPTWTRYALPYTKAEEIETILEMVELLVLAPQRGSQREPMDAEPALLGSARELTPEAREVLAAVEREVWRNLDNSDVHTTADIAADVVRKLSRDYLGAE